MKRSLQRTCKNRPCIEIPADWTNERVEGARKTTSAICVELWGNRRMLRAKPEHAADLREMVTGRREDPSEQAWTAGPWPNWMSTTEAENFLRNIPWEIEIVLGTQKTNVDGVDTRMLKVTAKEPPKKLLKLGDKWLLVIHKIRIYIYIYNKVRKQTAATIPTQKRSTNPERLRTKKMVCRPGQRQDSPVQASKCNN